MNFSMYLTTATLLLNGVVDQVEDQKVSVELATHEGIVENVLIPSWVFPCEPSEGLGFVIEMSSDQTVIKCLTTSS